MEFLVAHELLDPASDPAERAAAARDPGLAYYLLRLDRLRLAGDCVLDAGCGMGTWSVALAQRFSRVEALDRCEQRLGVLRRLIDRLNLRNIHVHRQALERLPFPDASFDAVLCDSALRSTQASAVLGEFQRVLRPGGRFYACLHADGWARYLMRQGGQHEPELAQTGSWALYKTAWHRAVQTGLVEELCVIRQRRPALVRVGLDIGGRVGLVRQVFCKQLLQARHAGRSLRRAITRGCGRHWLPRLYQDVWRSWCGQDVTADFDDQRLYLPEELLELTEQAGFADFQWGAESSLVCNWRLATPCARYPGHFAGQPAVWECLATRPRPMVEALPEKHYQAALAASANSVYLEPAANAVLSNVSRWTFPRWAYERAVELARVHGGPRYLERLVRVLVDQAPSQEEAARRIVQFVQRALYRDPVAQPLTEQGLLPSPVITLFARRGRCGHAASLVAELGRLAGLNAGVQQLPHHVTAYIEIDGRRLVADADAYKHGIIPCNEHGRWVSFEDLQKHPYHLDCQPATGFYILPGTRYTAGSGGGQLRGYVDALYPEDRGYLSSYYADSATGVPPTLPSGLRFLAERNRFVLQWSPSRAGAREELVGYRVAVGSRSRGWSYQNLGCRDEVLQPLPRDVLWRETSATEVDGLIPAGVSGLYASVTAVSSRIEQEPRTHFMPSEEACLDLRRL